MGLSLSLNNKGAFNTGQNLFGNSQTSTTKGFVSSNPNDRSSLLSGTKQIPISSSTPQITQGSNPGMISQPKPVEHPTASTPVKKQTTADGTITEYHAPTQLPPDDPSNKYNTATGSLNPNYKDPNSPKPSTSTSSNDSTSSGNPSTTYGGLINSLANQGGSDYNNLAKTNIGLLSDTAKGNEALAANAKSIADAAGQKISDIGGQGARGSAGYLSTGTSPIGEGNQAILNQSTAAQQQAVSQGANMQLQGNAQGLQAQGQEQSGYNSAAGQALSGQGTSQSALNSAAGYMQPTSNIILRDPTTGAVIGNQNLDSLAATQGRLSGIQSGAAQVAGTTGSNISDLTTQLSTINSASPAFDANTSQLSDFAAQGGLNKNVPLISALQQHFGQNFMNDPAVTGFLAKIASVNSQYQQITGTPGTLDPQKVTLDGLNTAIQAMKDDITNKKQALTDQKNKLSNSGSGSSTSVQYNPNGTLKAVSF